MATGAFFLYCAVAPDYSSIFAAKFNFTWRLPFSI
jgi:hypothetical protein